MCVAAGMNNATGLRPLTVGLLVDDALGDTAGSFNFERLDV